MYAEAALVVPSALPLIDGALAKVAIPTHETWGEHFASAKQFAQNFKARNADLFAEVVQKPADFSNNASVQNVLGTVSESLGSVTLALEQAKS